MLRFLINVLGGGWRVGDRLQEEQDRRHFGQWTFVLALMVVFPVSCAATSSVSGNVYLGLAVGVAAIAVPGWTARAFDRLLRAFGFSAPFAGGWSRVLLVLMWLGVVGASVLYFRERRDPSAEPRGLDTTSQAPEQVRSGP
jgi:hypothetical protein